MTEESHTEQPQPNAKSHVWRNGCLGVVAAIIGLSVLGSIVGPQPPEATAPAEPATGSAAPAAKPVLKTTARELFSAYQANQIAAGKKFEGQPLAVSGTVQAIDESFGSPVLALATSNEFLPVRATFGQEDADRLALIAKGQKVELQCGELREAGGFLSLDDCSFQ